MIDYEISVFHIKLRNNPQLPHQPSSHVSAIGGGGGGVVYMADMEASG